MIGEWIRFGVTALCVVGGLFALLTALLGLFRFDYALNRLHAAAIADTLALGLVLLGVMVAVGFRAVLWKLVLVLVIQWCTSPLSCARRWAVLCRGFLWNWPARPAFPYQSSCGAGMNLCR